MLTDEEVGLMADKLVILEPYYKIDDPKFNAEMRGWIVNLLRKAEATFEGQGYKLVRKYDTQGQ